MIFYHGTSENSWKLIQAEGVLWGGDYSTGGRRFTYLSPEMDVANAINDAVVLEVKYDPVGRGSGKDNYDFTRPLDIPADWTIWQFLVFVPIPLSQLRRLE